MMIDERDAGTRPVEAVSFLRAMRFWLKLGFVSFGGPAGQIAIMHQELVERRRWISEKRFLHALNFCMILPGPEAQQLATYIGWLMHRTWGGIVAGGLFVLPSLFILIGLSWIYVAFGSTPAVAAVFYGIKPAVGAIVVHAAYRIGSRTLKSKTLWAIAIAAFAAIFAFRLPFPLVIAAAALAGYAGMALAPEAFASAGRHGGNEATYGRAWIDDDTPIPEHARFRHTGATRAIIVGLLLWVLPITIFALGYGWQGLFAQMSWFFTKAALLTFGGAYAVLPYVYQGAVEQHHWIGASQMIDGLALGESTPGPLIMVVTFVGFVAGYLHVPLGADHAFAGGVVAAFLVTWFTFLPSFLFILVGGPLVESSRGDLKLIAPLQAISAAVVGAILSLSLFFLSHTLWPEGLAAHLDLTAAALAMAASVALFHFKRGVIEVLAVAALLGLLIS